MKKELLFVFAICLIVGCASETKEVPTQDTLAIDTLVAIETPVLDSVVADSSK